MENTCFNAHLDAMLHWLELSKVDSDEASKWLHGYIGNVMLEAELLSRNHKVDTVADLEPRSDHVRS